ncbi:MAG: hypothetical protein PHD05_09575 [Sphaerochaetaceae bacterium]|nr:hypothetical protein [Sphaerochaetaceae bacterium]
MNKLVFQILFLLSLPLIYGVLIFGVGLESISSVIRLPLDFPIMFFLFLTSYIVWSGLTKKEFVAATFAHIEIMTLFKAKNPKLFWMFILISALFIFSTFAHLIYFDFVVIMGITFLGLIFLSLVSQVVLRGKLI